MLSTFSCYLNCNRSRLKAPTLVVVVVVVAEDAGSLARRRCSCEGEVLAPGVGGGAAGGGGAYWMHDAARGDAGAGDVLLDAAEAPLPLWWFSVCRRRLRASQYDLPQPSALHS